MEAFLKDLLALICSLVPEGSLPGDLIDDFLEVLEVCFPRVHFTNFTPHLIHIPQDANSTNA